MSADGTDAFGFCERCDGEGKHLIPVMGYDGATHYGCRECLDNQEKGVNVRPEWLRTHGGGRYTRPGRGCGRELR